MKLLNKLHLFYTLDDFITIIFINPSLILRWEAGIISKTSLVTALKRTERARKKKQEKASERLPSCEIKVVKN